MIKNKDTDPKAFEQYFKDLVKLHYQPANYRDVPDNQGGDLGVECYTLTGHAFQCYLPEQTSDIKKLVAAQKRKINDDTKKLSENKVKLERLFGSTKISRWILATSAHKSAEMTAYCAEKSLAIRGLDLNYISEDFEVLIHTELDYRLEAESLYRQAYQLNIDFEKNSTQKVDNWIDENLTFLSNLDRKLPKIIGDEDQRKRSKSNLVSKYLNYQNLLEKLLHDWPDTYQIIINSVANRQEYLETRFLTSPDLLPNEVIKEELQNLDNDLSREACTLKRTDIELIKWGVVSDWLIRCPLDF
jgi:hypothetical protein